MEIWTPVMGEMLVVKIEPMNKHVYMQWPSTGHNLAPRMSAFFMIENKAFVEITGAKVNKGAGYGLEVPRIYHMDLTFMLTK